MAPHLKLYTARNSCSLVPEILLEESGLPYETEAVQFQNPAYMETYLSKINPKAQVPVLVIRDGETETIITEQNAIQTAISDLAPEKHFYGRTPIEKLRTLEANSWLGANHSVGWGASFRPQRFAISEEGKKEASQKGREKIKAMFQMAEGRLKGGKSHLIGESLTGADLYLWVIRRWTVVLDPVDVGEVPEVDRFYGEIEGKASVRKVLERNGAGKM